jgi:Zn-dependent protease with chaperone function
MSAMFYLLRGAALALAWLFLLNAIASVVVAAVARRATSGVRTRGARFWLALRLSPAAVSMAFIVFVFAPSYFRYEPLHIGEAFAFTASAAAIAGIALVAAAAARGAAAWRAARRRTHAWKQAARPLPVGGAALPVFAVDMTAPVMALAGIFRPRLLITRGVLDVLTDEELSAGIAHELGHWRAWDNLKRLAMRAAPDLLVFTPVAAAIEARWASAAEHAADHDACGDPQSRCALASALVKVARLTPRATPLGEPISTLVDGGEIASRVERLLSDTPPNVAGTRSWPFAIGVSALIAASYVPLLHAVHEATEILVHTLP